MEGKERDVVGLFEKQWKGRRQKGGISMNDVVFVCSLLPCSNYSNQNI